MSRRRLLHLGFDATAPADRLRENPPRSRRVSTPAAAPPQAPAGAPLGGGWVA